MPADGGVGVVAGADRCWFEEPRGAGEHHWIPVQRTIPNNKPAIPAVPTIRPTQCLIQKEAGRWTHVDAVQRPRLAVGHVWVSSRIRLRSSKARDVRKPSPMRPALDRIAA